MTPADMSRSLERTNVAARDPVGDLEQRVGGKKRLYFIGGIVGLGLCLLVLRACNSRQKTPPPPPPRPVAVAKVVQKDVPVYLNEIGTCAAYETVQVQAQVSGQIISRNFQDGSDVKKGDLLFTIDPRPYQATVDQAKAQAALDQATLKRQVELRKKGVTAAQDFDTAQANAQKSEGAA
ncbi:MAG: rane fusion protein multidrug efflux system, partial [Verrucomicrobiota bacterium]